MMKSEKTFILIHDNFFSQFIMCFGSQYGESQLNEKYIQNGDGGMEALR